ncbi:MAG: DUF5067 domain-containing protein [Paraclostridium sp.]
MKIKNKILGLVLVSALSLGLVACSSDEGNVTNGESTVEDTNDNNEENTEKVEGQIGNYIVKIKESKVVKNSYEGYDMLMVTLDFTNNSEETISFDMATMVKAFQDGIEIEQDFDSAISGDNASKDIRPNNTIDVNVLFKINGDTEVEVEITELFAFDNNDKVFEVINITN